MTNYSIRDADNFSFQYSDTVADNNRRIFEILAENATFIAELITPKKKYTKKRYWVADLWKQRDVHGFYKFVFPMLKLDRPKFNNYFRFTPEQFEELVQMVTPLLQRQVTTRMPILVGERLAITLRYLASGDSMISMSYHHLVGKSTACTIILETLEALWNVLSPIVLRKPNREDWKLISKGFEEKWHFPNCLGALDGKHVVIQAPHNAGSQYYNFKHQHSIVLLALCGPDYQFILVDIGGYGRQSDGGTFARSSMGQCFRDNSMDVPAAAPVSREGTVLPYVMVGDQGFPLLPYLMRPYAQTSNLATEYRIFNYRLGRARRISENSFGIMSAEFRIFRKPIVAQPKTLEAIIKAAVCLHNYHIKNPSNFTYGNVTMVDRFDGNNNVVEGSWRQIVRDDRQMLQPIEIVNNTSTRYANEIREKFRDYFNDEGAIPWQFWKIYE